MPVDGAVDGRVGRVVVGDGPDVSVFVCRLLVPELSPAVVGGVPSGLVALDSLVPGFLAAAWCSP